LAKETLLPLPRDYTWERCHRRMHRHLERLHVLRWRLFQAARCAGPGGHVCADPRTPGHAHCLTGGPAGMCR
jgi:hypothetical protein